jgi:hypothetical protein
MLPAVDCYRSNHIFFPSRVLTSNKWHNSFRLFKTLIYLSFLSPRISPSYHPLNFFNTECHRQSSLNSAQGKGNTFCSRLSVPSTAGLNASHKMLLLRVQATAIVYCSYRNEQKQRKHQTKRLKHGKVKLSLCLIS